MKILLIYPYCLEPRIHPEDISVVPIGVYYVSAVLRENHYDVEILNWYNINQTPHRIEEILREKKPDIIGFSILHANRWGGIEVARVAKNIDNNIMIVFGGIGASFLWEHLLTHFPEIDYVVIGEGEYGFLELVKCLDQSHPQKLERIPGIAFRRSGRAFKTDSAEAIGNLDEVPNPAKYFDYRHLTFTRGCVWKCSFCGSPQYWGHRIRFHSVKYFVEQIERLYSRGINFFYFSDDTFTIDQKRVIEICQSIIRKKLNITWAAISRVDDASDETLLWMRRAGCIQISYGVESGSQKIRKFLKKNITTRQIKKAFALTQRYGIMARAYFIYGCPGENWETIQETIDLMNEIKPLSAIFYILDIFPGTELYEDYKKRENMSDDIWLNRVEDIMHFETDPALNSELIVAFGKKLRTGFYSNLPEYVKGIELIDEKKLYPYHSDFYSRLAMTFDHGDYARIEAIKENTKIAESLYQKALDYFPNQRAFLGLGILKQKKNNYAASSELLNQGLAYFPDDPQLNICQGVSLMNMGQYKNALDHFLKFQNIKEAVQYAANCYTMINDVENASILSRKLQSMQKLS
jgi:radical SAM superfamily enzyme YgiQ (UPF0313 family)